MPSLLIKGNCEMGPEVQIFNLPAKKTCKPSEWCLKGRRGKPMCYALNNRFIWPNVIKGAEARLKMSKQKDFIEKMIATIQRRKIKYFRWHASGDIYSPKYAQKLYEIMLACPNTLFRSTTRRTDFQDIILKLHSLPNMIMRQSLDYCIPEPTMGLPFVAQRNLAIAKSPKVITCIGDCPACNYQCWKNNNSIHVKEL